MSAVQASLARVGRLRRGLGSFWAGVTAVGIKELRSRMRGRRAFVVVTIYLLLLSAFAFGIYHYLRAQSSLQQGFFPGPMPLPVDLDRPVIDPGSVPTSAGTALSGSIGHAVFSGLLLVETLLVLVLAPAFTTGAISMEREKQTLDLLVATPLSTFGIVVGKLLSALTYVFLLIFSSIPLASVVFAFGGVGPEDLVRGYAFLFALAFGVGAIGLFVSALVRRTQTATVITFVLVLLLTVGTTAVHEYLMVTSRARSDDGVHSVLAARRHQAPEALLWLNPFVADLDLVCTSAPNAYHVTCGYLSDVTGKPYFGDQLFAVSSGRGGGVSVVCDAKGCTDSEGMHWGITATEAGSAPVECRSDTGCVAVDDVAAEPVQDEVATFGFPRDTFWPKSALAFVVVGAVLTVASAQLVAPTRRLRLPRLRRRRGSAQGATSEVPT